MASKPPPQAKGPQDFLTSHPAHLPTPPFIHVPGIANFRDCGGYECAAPPEASDTAQSGGPGQQQQQQQQQQQDQQQEKYMVRRGLVFRCAHPTHLTAAGAVKLRDELAITDIFDLRSVPEIKKLAMATGQQQQQEGEEGKEGKADESAQSGQAKNETEEEKEKEKDRLDTSQGFVVIPGIKRTFTPVYEQEDYSPQALARKLGWYSAANDQGKDYSEGFVNAYRDIATHAARGGAYGTILRQLLRTIRERQPERELQQQQQQQRPDSNATTTPSDGKRNGGLIFHCTAGKDRTGILAAVLLKLCDVPDPVIEWEYAITEPGLGDWRTAFIDHITQRGSLGGGGGIVNGSANGSANGNSSSSSSSTSSSPSSSSKVTRAEAARICGSRASNIRAFIRDVLQGEFGGVHRYLTEMVGLTDAEVLELRRGLVVRVDPDSQSQLVNPVEIAGWTVEGGMDDGEDGEHGDGGEQHQ